MMPRPIPECITDKDQKIRDMAALLLECRDALPAIPRASMRLYGLDPRLADRIEECLKPWKTGEVCSECTAVDPARCLKGSAGRRNGFGDPCACPCHEEVEG